MYFYYLAIKYSTIKLLLKSFGGFRSVVVSRPPYTRKVASSILAGNSSVILFSFLCLRIWQRNVFPSTPFFIKQ